VSCRPATALSAGLNGGVAREQSRMGRTEEQPTPQWVVATVLVPPRRLEGILRQSVRYLEIPLHLALLHFQGVSSAVTQLSEV